MSIHPETQKVIDYPDTLGKSVALDHFDWQKLDKHEEARVSARIISLAQRIDEAIADKYY